MVQINKSSALYAAVGALLFGLSVFLGAHFARVVRLPLLYHAVIYGIFFGLYKAMPGGFEANFNTPDKKSKFSTSDIGYYTMVVHSTTGFGDVYPTSRWGKLCVSLHTFLVFMATANMIPFGSLMGGGMGGSNMY